MSPWAAGTSGALRALRGAIAAAALLVTPALAAQSPPASDPPSAAGEPAAERRTTGAIERGLLGAGFENVTVSPGKGIQIAFENRRYRRSAEALGIASAAAGEPSLMAERRLGLIAAAMEPLGPNSDETFRVLYPSDGWFPGTPEGPRHSSTVTRADLELGALVDYRVGHILDPLQLRTQFEPRLLFNPWTGARVRVGVVIPLQNDFPWSESEPDINRIRPGRGSLEQFGWIPGIALASFSGGYFGDNRWGMSAGAAHPLRGGEWMLDAQIDRTGFLAFTEAGTLYSPMDRTSGFAGLTYRPPVADLGIKARAGQFLHGDRGVDLELRRTFDDLDVAYFLQRTDGLYVFGIRVGLPVPPWTRSTGSALRVQLPPRFAVDFRDKDVQAGHFVQGVASREEFLRQLDPSSLGASRDHFLGALGRPVAARPTGPGEWVSFTGMSGFINTPWGGVLEDRAVEVGYGYVPRRWVYDRRDQNDNRIFYTTLGFLPRVETALRWTQIPGYRSFEEIAPDSKLVDMDRMASVRVALLEPRAGRPGLSLGVEDAQGTRRFHSSYAVAGLPFTLRGRACRLAGGYGFRMFKAVHRVLDGTFGAAELSAWPWLRTQLEYDSEKWNAGLGVSPGAGFRIRAGLLNLESFSVGAGWSRRL